MFAFARPIGMLKYTYVWTNHRTLASFKVPLVLGQYLPEVGAKKSPSKWCFKNYYRSHFLQCGHNIKGIVLPKVPLDRKHIE